MPPPPSSRQGKTVRAPSLAMTKTPNASLHCHSPQSRPKGVYPQSDGSLAVVDIDASKGFVDPWEHLALAILANFDVKNQLKRLSTKI